MKTTLAALLFFTSLLTSNAQAAVWQCFSDPVKCPSGDHMRCIGHGWCGPNCDICRSANKDATLATETNEPFLIEATERYSPWSDGDYCQRARQAAEDKAAQACGAPATRVSEYSEEWLPGLQCKASAKFACE